MGTLPLLAAWVTLSGLSGCATTTTAPATALDPLARHHVGRLAVKVEGDEARSFSAGFELQGTDQRGQLALISPLGTQVGRAVWQPGAVQWQTADGERRFDTLDDLSQALLGETVPLAALFDWIAGRPWSSHYSRPLADATTPEETGFRQLGWSVQTGRLADGLIVAQRRLPAPTVTVRIKLDTP
jgi:outer membrane lipoprotein LolB